MTPEVLAARRKTAVRQDAVNDAFGPDERLVPPQYPLPLALSDRRLRLLAQWESCEALKLLRAAGPEVPHAHP